MRTRVLPLLVAVAILATSVASSQSQIPAADPGGSAAPGGWCNGTVEEVLPGVWRVRFGSPERFTPVAVRESPPREEGFKSLPAAGPAPFAPEAIRGRITQSRTVVYVPCDEPGEQIYGFGLDPGAYEQKGLFKHLTVCAGVVGKTGASHGPVPFYVSTKGYGVYVDTARVPDVQVARLTSNSAASQADNDTTGLKTSERDLYSARPASGRGEVIFDLPGDSHGVDVYLFAGPSMREAVERYNLFSGGGAVPPLWGLGLKYRMFTRATQASVLHTAESLRAMNIPCDMLGLEPGWQTHAYSCSFVWSKERFPDAEKMIRQLRGTGFKLNLWEHAYVNPSSPLFAPLKSRAGDFLVWGGLVVDFPDPVAFRTFADYHEREFVTHGILGFKGDECDRQPPTDATPFNFPYSSIFPSGIDGDQMSQLYGYLYQRSLFAPFKAHNLRTWSDVRATTALAAPLPFNLYSDAYTFDQYLRQLINASFTGLLWSPEVREAGSLDELLNRVAMSAFAPQMCLNLWFMPHPLWEQYDGARNKADRLLPEAEQKAVAGQLRTIINQRYELLPYLYSAFMRYHNEGLPPVRSLLLDFPKDKNIRNEDNAFMFGDNLLAAPFLGETRTRKLTLPSGTRWCDVRTGKWFPGGSTITVTGAPGQMPLYARENSLVPLAEPVQHVERDTVFRLTVKVFGSKPAPFSLYEDDGETFDFAKGAANVLTLHWDPKAGGTVERKGEFPGRRYEIAGWETVNSPQE